MLSPVALFPPFVFGFLDDMYLVLLVLVISYMLFLLYTTFRDQPVIFALAAVVGFYFLVAQPFPVIFLLIFVFFIIMFGNQLQMILYFGLFPVLKLFGAKNLPGEQQAMMGVEAEKVGEIEQKLLRNQQVSEEEKAMYQQYQEQNMQGGGQQLDQRRAMHR